MILKNNFFIDGKIEGFTHKLPLRVQYEDVDIGGIVYHSKHLSYMERGRSSFIRLTGFANEDLLKENIVLVVSKADMQWLKPLKLGAVVNIETKINKINKASLEISQTIIDFEKSIVYSKGKFRIAAINTAGKIVGLNKKFNKCLEKYYCLTLD